MKYQHGSIRKVGDAWEFRYRDANRVMRQKTFSIADYPTEKDVRVAMQRVVFTLNDPSLMDRGTPFSQLVERYIVEERLREIAAQAAGPVTEPGLAYASAKRYLSTLKVHILPRWGHVPIKDIRPMDVLVWLRDLELSGMAKASIKTMMHILFERAMLWELIEVQRNPIELVKLKGVSVRQKKKVSLTVEQFQQLRDILPEPYKTMVTFAICTGLRVSEITAVRWEHIRDGALLVQASSWQGRIGRVKTQASGDEIPLHPDILAQTPARAEGLIFPRSDGRPFNGSDLQTWVIKPAGKRIGIDGLGWHTLRHTYRTLLDEAGAPIGVQQKLMRHANVSTTMNVYGTSVMRAKREANSKVVEMVVGRAG